MAQALETKGRNIDSTVEMELREDSVEPGFHMKSSQRAEAQQTFEKAQDAPQTSTAKRNVTDAKMLSLDAERSRPR